MKQTRIIAIVVAGMLAAWGAMPSAAQSVHDLTDHEPTTEEIQEGLQLPNAAAPAPLMRGIGPVELAEVKEPHCEYYRQQIQDKSLSRGIALTPDMSSIALKVTFASNSAQLTPEAIRVLDNLGRALHSHEFAACCFQIEGHTDRIGGDAYNLQLSQRRAQTVAAYLIEHYSLKERAIAVGYGRQQPIADNATAEGRQKNRRVQIVNLGTGH
jgi:outer membrane protein OmpA-like peptidoglycan-associated protein